MENQIKILELINTKKAYELELEKLIYGSVEVRKKNDNKYIYTHYRENGLLYTKYVGEYSEELYNLIINNNNKAKEIKKEIKKINNELKEYNYIDEELPQNVALNIDFAKRHLADSIYKQAILEGVATTLTDTENIIEGGKINNMSSEDVMKIINLKHAWDFILNKNVILTESNYSILCSINKFVEEGFYYTPGILRTTPVKIGGTTWVPELPIETDIKIELNNIIKSDKQKIDIAIELLLFVTKKQMFIDGNKRTSLIFANHYLISQGQGLIVIPIEKIEDYKKLLIEYYESNNSNRIKKFIKDKCIIKIK